MKKSRPILTAACFLLFVLAFASANVKPASLYCGGGMLEEEVQSVQRLVDDARNAWQQLIRPGDPAENRLP